MLQPGHSSNMMCDAVDASGYSGCKSVRQVLVAKPGQKPCAWVSFDSLRQNLLSWQGYALMAASWQQHTLVLPTAAKQEQADADISVV